MNGDLKAALMSMAQFDGWRFSPNGLMCRTERTEEFHGLLEVTADYWIQEKLRYHKSADAIIPIFIKLRHYGHDDLHWLDLEKVLHAIGQNDLEKACLLMGRLCDRVMYKLLKS